VAEFCCEALKFALSAGAANLVLIRHSLLFRTSFAVLVPLLKFAFGLQPVVQVATVNSAALDVDFEGAPTDFFWTGYVISQLFLGA
jgi:hypothetical protein